MNIEGLLSNLDQREKKVNFLMNFIMKNPSYRQKEIVMFIEKQFYSKQATIDKQISIFHTISQILLKSNQKKDLRYFKAFGIKIKHFLYWMLQKITDIKLIENINRILEVWQKQQIFSQSFMEKLKILSKQAKQKLIRMNSPYEKYDEVFLINITEVNNAQLCQNIYKFYCQYTYILKQISVLNKKFKELRRSKNLTNRVLLIQEYNKTNEKLQSLFHKMKQMFNLVMKQIRRQYQNYRDYKRLKNRNLFDQSFMVQI